MRHVHMCWQCLQRSPRLRQCVVRRRVELALHFAEAVRFEVCHLESCGEHAQSQLVRRGFQVRDVRDLNGSVHASDAPGHCYVTV